MPIIAKWLGRGIYQEVWRGQVTTEQILASAAERIEWRRTDGDSFYCVLIDFRECLGIPITSVLNRAAGMHPRKKVFFVLYNTTSFFTLLAKLVRATGYHIDVVTTFEEAYERAKKLLELHQSLTDALLGSDGDTQPMGVRGQRMGSIFPKDWLKK